MKSYVRLAHLGLLLLWLALPRVGRAQGGCLLLPVPLAQRVQQAPLVVEARVTSQQVVLASGGHIITRNTLEVYKLFKGELPSGPLVVHTLGGTLGGQREVVSGVLQLRTGEQGLFFLEADVINAASQPGELRAYAGPQGFIRYNLTDLTASEPLGQYASIGRVLYGAVAASAGPPYRELAPNADLAAAGQRRAQRAARPLAAAAPVISSFAPGAVTAGTSAANATSATGVLTIVGTGFGPAQGAGFVQFRNADSPGPDASPNYTQPLASDYLSWSDTQIRVRVPSQSQSGNTAGTGFFQVADNGGALATR